MAAVAPDDRRAAIVLVVIVVFAVLAVASLLVAFSYYCYIRNKVSRRVKGLKGNGCNKDKSESLQITIDKGVHVFTFKQLHAATSGFGKNNVIGHGGFGSVYKGLLPDGRKIAVKLMDRCGKQGEEEFEMEVELLSRLHSPYLLGLLGYCTDNDHKLLVYEFMANGGLQEHLYPESGMRTLLLFFRYSAGWVLIGHSAGCSLIFVCLVWQFRIHNIGKQNNDWVGTMKASLFTLFGHTQLLRCIKACKNL